MNPPGTSSKTLDSVVPRIYVALPDPGAADLTLPKADSPVVRRLVADLLIFYAFDAGSHYEIVSHRDLEELGATCDELHDRALLNLRALKLDVRANKGDRILMLTAGGNYEATLILLPEIWDSVSQTVSGQIVAAVPARDVLYFTGDADTENLATCAGGPQKRSSKLISHYLGHLFVGPGRIGKSTRATHNDERAQQSDAHEPPPSVSVSMLRIHRVLISVPARVSSGGR